MIGTGNKIIKLFFGLYCLFVLSCKELPESSSNSLIYEVEDKKIELILNTKRSHLKMGETSTVQFVTTNIDPTDLGIYGCGFRNISTASKMSLYQITPTLSCVKNGNIQVTVTEMIDREKALKNTFYIPVSH